MTTSITLSQEHFIQNFLARILERILSREPNRDVSVIRERLNSELPRLADNNGVLISSCPRLLEALLKTGLSEIAKDLNGEFLENPAFKSINSRSMVLIHIKKEDVLGDIKPLLTRFEKQAKAVEQTGAIAEVFLENFDEWPNAVRSKFEGVWAKVQCPRLMLAVGINDMLNTPKAGIASKCLAVEVGEESPAIR